MTDPMPKDEEDVAEDRDGLGTDSSITISGLKQVTLTRDTLEGQGKSSESVPSSQEGGDPYIGKTVDGRYRVEAQLGEGGMGVVYRCRHTIIDKKVAMKVLRADLARNEEVTERFLNEARSASSIGNPHIIDISDFGRLPDNATYFIMEFLTGTPLADLVEARKPLPPARAGHIALQLTEGLAEAHKAGIVHRDLKPDNIFLVRRGSHDDFVKILDFGIAKASSKNTKLTQAGQVFGTPHYMSPEQASGSPVDHRSDIYALGVILYELATGQLPFDADNFMAILTQHMYKSPTPPSKVEGLTQDLPQGLEDVILRCMAKEPGERYQTMTELGADLKCVFAGELPAASRDPRARTDSYASPEEYYERRSAISVPSPVVTPNISLYTTIGILAALAAGTGVYFATKSSEAPAAQTEPVIAATTPAPEETSKEGAPPGQIAPKKTQVALAVAPLTAHVFDGEKDLGPSPLMVEVGDTPLVLHARLLGYQDKEISIDGSKDKVTVELQRAATKAEGQTSTPSSSPRPVAPPSPKPKPKPLGGGELVNPWD